MHDLILRSREGLPPSSVRRRRSRLVAVGVVVLSSLVIGPGTAYATTVDVTPTSLKWQIKSVVEAAEQITASASDGLSLNGTSITGVGAGAATGVGVIAGAPEIVTVGAVAGAALAYKQALDVAWKLGDKIGHDLPCFTCTHVSSPATTQGFSNGMSLDNVVFQSGPGGTHTVGFVSGQLTWPSSFTVSGVVATGYYANTVGGAANGGASNGVNEGSTSPRLASREACAGGCGFNETAYFASACFVVYGPAGVFLRIPYGTVPAGTCARAVGNPDATTTGQTQTPTSQSGGGDGNTPNTATNLAVRPYSDCTPTAGGSVTHVVGALSASFHDRATTMPNYTLPACADGSVRTGFGADVVPLTVGGGIDTTGITTPLVKPTTLPTTVPGHPEFAPCLPGGAQYPCQVTLTKTDAANNTRTYDPATDWPIYDPASDPEGTKIGPQWSCKWGTLAVPVQECKPVWADPPRVVPKPPPSENNCDGSGFSFNPVSWVVVPLKCLFIPRESVVQAASSTLADAWNGTALGTVTSAVGDVTAPITALQNNSGPGNCDGPAFVIPQLPAMHSALTLHPLSTCNRLTTYLLGIYLPIASALIYLGGFFAGTRTLLKGFNIDQEV